MSHNEQTRIEIELQEDRKPTPYKLIFGLIFAVWLLGAVVKAV